MVSYTAIPGGIRYSSGSLSGELSYHVKQTPNELDKNQFGCCFLASQYFTAESDYYKVNLKREDGSKDVLGWLFHINLMSEGEEFYNALDDFLLKYMNVCIRKLIDYSVDKGLMKSDSGTLDDLGLSDDLIVMIYRLSICKEIDIMNLYPSLYDNGFEVIDNPSSIDISQLRVNHYRKERIDDFKSDHTRNCINLYCASPVFINSTFVKSLFVTYLPSIEDPYLRYLMLYQIIEILMSIEYGNRYYEYVEKFGNDKRHNLMEKFGELSSEARLIGKIYEIGAGNTFHKDFISSAESLLGKIGEADFKENPSFQEYMYKVRNLIVHNLSVMRCFPVDMDRIADIYEFVIADLVHRTTITVRKDKKLFVIDMNKTYKENKGFLYNAYHC